jgi:glutamate 5-kinase
MKSSDRQTYLQSGKLVVIKIGTNVLTNEQGILDRERIQALVDQLVRIKQSGRQVVLVSSGAIGAGVGSLKLTKRPTELPQLQACAAVGQSILMRIYQECLAPHQILPAQLLLTASDFDSRPRYLNVRNTIRTLFEYDCLPIINENDTVSTAEIKFGDNDHLAALVTNLIQAPLLILLTNVDGLFTGDPRVDPSACRVEVVPEIDRSITDYAQATKSVLGTGGMKSKLRAARLATAAGGTVVMANGAMPGVLDAIFTYQSVGTLFLPHGDEMSAWKRWLGYTARPQGELQVDAGARKALVEKGKSLLPVGVTQVRGEFGKGDVLTIRDVNGDEFARGLSNYSSSETMKIVGQPTEQIRQSHGELPYEEIIHRDNLVILE